MLGILTSLCLLSSHFFFLDILKLCFFLLLLKLWISVIQILYSYLEYWCWPCSRYTHPLHVLFHSQWL